MKIHNAYPGGDAINDFREFVYGNVSNRAVDRSITMKKLLEMLTEEMQQAFTVAGYDGTLGKVMLSNRPDLCEYQ